MNDKTALCQGQKGTVANHVWETSFTAQEYQHIFRIERCSLCGEIRHEKIAELILFPKEKTKEAIERQQSIDRLIKRANKLNW